MAAGDGKLKHLRREIRGCRSSSTRTSSRTAASSSGARPSSSMCPTAPIDPPHRDPLCRCRGGRLLRRRPRRHRRPDRTRRHARLGLPRRPDRDGRVLAMSDFAAVVAAFLAETFESEPVFATVIGEHAHDGRWPDLTAAGRAARLAATDRWLATFRAMTDAHGGRRDRSRPDRRRARMPRGSAKPSCARTPGTRSTGST